MTDPENRSTSPDSHQRGLRLITFVMGGLLLAIARLVLLSTPFITVSSTAPLASISVTYGLCSSPLGQGGQVLSSQVSSSCGEISIGFFASWAAMAGGVALVVWGFATRSKQGRIEGDPSS
jgi:hypothetical protein